jgi:hypothetical protein
LILLVAVVLGFGAGLLRSKLAKRPYQAFNLRLEWLVILAFVPQWIAFNLPATSSRLSSGLVAAILVSTQALLLLFVGANWRRPGFWLLGLGLGLNFVVISLNGGMMPISPEIIQHLNPDAPPGFWEIGHRLGSGKDIVLPESQTVFAFLSDRLTLPDWIPYRVVFSLGDMFIAAGAFWLLWCLGGIQPQKEINNEIR